MSRTAFLTRAFLRAQVEPPSLSMRGAAPSPATYFCTSSMCVTGR